MKLTKVIVIKNVIHHIDITNKGKFIIHLMSNKMDGDYLYGSGALRSRNTEIEVCKTQHVSDYKTVSDWIDNELK